MPIEGFRRLKSRTRVPPCSKETGLPAASIVSRLAKQVGVNKLHTQKSGLFKKPDFWV